MKNLYKEIFKNSIKVGDMVYIVKEGGELNEMLQGKVNKILPSQVNGVKVEVILDTQSEEFLVKEIGFVEYVVRDNGVEYGTLK